MPRLWERDCPRPQATAAEGGAAARYRPPRSREGVAAIALRSPFTASAAAARRRPGGARGRAGGRLGVFYGLQRAFSHRSSGRRRAGLRKRSPDAGAPRTPPQCSRGRPGRGGARAWGAAGQKEGGATNTFNPPPQHNTHPPTHFDERGEDLSTGQRCEHCLPKEAAGSSMDRTLGRRERGESVWMG